MQVQDGMNYAPKGKPAPVCEDGAFIFSAIALDHGHIYGMCNGLIEAGGQLNHVYLVNHEGEHHFHVDGKVGYPFFGQLILDCLHRTEHAMTQEHAFKAAELCLIAQRDAELIEGANKHHAG